MNTTLSSARSEPARNRLILVALWFFFYASFTLVTPPLLDDADSVHAEASREMLLRHDWVTLYANGIRYLEKAPLLYWSMAASFKLFGVQTAAARLPLALTVLALALAMESFARRAFASIRAGLYAALILLSSFGIFIFTRIIIPDAMVCLWLTLALFCYLLTESSPAKQTQPDPLLCYAFAVCCALNFLTKGLIGIVFPILIVLTHLILTRRNLRSIVTRLAQLAPISSTIVFLIIAAPWHILIALANPTQGHPSNITFTHHHWQVPLPTDGNVHGWLWFYFVNEHLLRYLNLRVPHDYDTVPLYLFWGLCLVWIMPWSAFLFHAIWPFRLSAIPSQSHPAKESAIPKKRHFEVVPSPAPWGANLFARESAKLLLTLWALVVLLFFIFSTRQEYYVLPALPAFAVLVGGWLSGIEQVPREPAYLRFLLHD